MEAWAWFHNTEQVQASQMVERLCIWLWQHRQGLLGEDPSMDVARLRSMRQRAPSVGQAEGQERCFKRQRSKENAKESKRQQQQRDVWMQVAEQPEQWTECLEVTVVHKSTEPALMDISEEVLAHWTAGDATNQGWPWSPACTHVARIDNEQDGCNNTDISQTSRRIFDALDLERSPPCLQMGRNTPLHHAVEGGNFLSDLSDR